MVKINKTNNEGETMKFLGTGYRQYKNNPSDLKVGERVMFNGHSSTTNQLFEIVSIHDNESTLRRLGRLKNLREIQVTYTLRNVKKNGELGKKESTTIARRLYIEVA